MIRFLVFGLAALVSAAACSPSAADAPITEQWRAVAVEATVLEAPSDHLGRLQFRGALELRGDEESFGGFSGLEALDDGRLLAVSDAGAWLSFRVRLDEAGALVGVDDVRTALMRDEHAEPFQSKADGDAEDITQLPDGRFAVSFEQTQSIRIYDLNRDGPFGAAVSGPSLAGVDALPANAGLEGVAATETGALLAGEEGGARRDTQLWLAPLDEQTPAPAFARYHLARGYSLTALDRLPDGGFVALERFYAPIIGARARITRFAFPEAGGQAEPEELAALAPPWPLDNFEGIAATRTASGATRLYVISDDNFSDRQRTLLLAFDIVE